MRSNHTFIFIKTIFISQKRVKLDLFIQQTVTKFLPARWPQMPLHPADSVVGTLRTNRQVQEWDRCMAEGQRMLLGHAPGMPPPDLGDQRSFPEMTLVENLKHYKPLESNMNSNDSGTPDGVNLNSTPKWELISESRYDKWLSDYCPPFNPWTGHNLPYMLSSVTHFQCLYF